MLEFKNLYKHFNQKKSSIRYYSYEEHRQLVNAISTEIFKKIANTKKQSNRFAFTQL